MALYLVCLGIDVKGNLDVKRDVWRMAVGKKVRDNESRLFVGGGTAGVRIEVAQHGRP
jgi:hypothetical protein